MRLIAPVCLIVLLGALPAPAQDSSRRSDPSDAEQQPVATQPPQTVRPGQRALTIFTVASNAIDSNINHDVDQVHSVGMVLGTGAQYRNDPQNPWLDVTYTTALHRYTSTARWNRLSQQLRAVVEGDLPGRWSWAAVGEVLLKGTSEDRELSNQYIISPRVDYRLGQWHRLRTYGAFRVKRYELDVARDSSSPYVGIELIQRSPRGDRWGLGARLERNDARSERQDYNRWTYDAEYIAPVGSRDRIELELKTRLQRYLHRVVEINDRDVPRRDQRWIPSITWIRAVSPVAELRIGYDFETRASNDPEREFAAHQFTASIVRRWW